MNRLLFLVLSFSLAPYFAAAEEPEPLTRILFGSCIKQEKPIPIFDAILEREPQLFLFLGDNIYADTSDMVEMRMKYEKLGSVSGFISLREACPLMALWDDHDYGLNDAGSEYEKKHEAQNVFLDFWGVPEESPRWDREGIYDSRIFGPPGKQVQVIMLDGRFFRGPLKTGERRVGGPYYPETDESIPLLGEAQWNWLEEELRKPVQVRLVCSGIQILAEASGQETWSNLPHERERLIELIASTGAGGVIFLSGDRHWSEISSTGESTPYPIFDITSSSLNQIHPRGTPTENRYRISKTTYHQENFGEIEIDWSSESPTVALRIRDIVGAVKLEQEIALGLLPARSE